MKTLPLFLAALILTFAASASAQRIPDFVPSSQGFSSAPATSGYTAVPPPAAFNPAPMPAYGGVPPAGYGMMPPPTISPTVPPPGAGADMMYGAPAYGAPPADMGYSPMAPQGPAPLLGGNSPTSNNGLSMLRYDYLYGGYQYTKPSSGNLDGSHGLGLGLSVQLFQPFYIKGGATWGSGDGGGLAGATGADYDFASISAAGGLYMPIFDNLHFFGELGMNYTSIDAQNSTLSFNDGSIFVRPGFRFQPISRLELQAGVMVGSSDNYDSRMVDLSAYWSLMNQFDVGVGGDFGDESKAFKLGVRFRW